MDQQSIMMYRSLKGLNAVEIYNALVSTLESEEKSYRAVTHYLQKSSCSSPKTPQPSESPAPILNESDEVFLLALSKGRFVSVRQLARRTQLHPSTVYGHLTHKLEFTVRYLDWFPHLLSEADKHAQAQLLFELIERLQPHKYRVWHDIVILNEPRFSFTRDHERVSLLEGTEAPERE
jgi:hypothetical protein